MKYLIDSNIIIYYLNGNYEAKDFIDKNYLDSAISIITYYEVLNFDFTSNVEEIVKNFLKRFKIIPLSNEIVEQALKNRKYKKIKMADNFILSTAQLHNLKIVTKNIKDFSYHYSNLLEPF